MKENLDILVIDDDMIDREAVRRYLGRPGRRKIVFHEASNGQEASALLAQKKFDCIFVDYKMPDTDGISLMRKFYNAETGLAPAPAVMLTGKGSEAVMIDALRWGIQDYLVKDNISPDSLNIAMAKATEMYELKRSQNQANEVMRHSQKMDAVGQLTSGVAHDFNNLLTIVLGNTRMQRRVLEGGGDIDFIKDGIGKKIDAIENAAKKGTDLVRRLMVFTRQRPLRTEMVQLNEHVHEIFELLKRTLGSAITIKTVFADDLWPVLIDPGQFENALINMAVNARDAMPEGGYLTIETKNVMVDEDYVFRNPDMSPGRYVMISLSDTGTGMAPDVMKRIFEPFFTTKPAGDGTGLGLSMVYGMLRQSGGYIHVYSEEGHGTVFRLYFPEHSAETEAAIENDAGLQGRGETILIVDDDEKALAVGALMLERLGYNVLQAPSGRTALEILKREQRNVRLLFTDVIMRDGMNGMELMEKTREFYPDIKILFTSGYTENTMPDYDLILDHDLIGKPYRKQELAKKIKSILDQREAA